LRLTFTQVQEQQGLTQQAPITTKLIEGSEVIIWKMFPPWIRRQIKRQRYETLSGSQYPSLIDRCAWCWCVSFVQWRDQGAEQNGLLQVSTGGRNFGHLLSVYGVTLPRAGQPYLHPGGSRFHSSYNRSGAYQVCQAIQKALDGMYSPEIPRSHHVCGLIKT
jgi:hypothetical protein